MKIILLATVLFFVYVPFGESVQCLVGKFSTLAGSTNGNRIESECTSPSEYCMRGEIVGTAFGLYSLNVTAWFCASASTCNEVCGNLLEAIINQPIPEAEDPNTDNSNSAVTMTSCKRACCDESLCNNMSVAEIQARFTLPSTSTKSKEITSPVTQSPTIAPETSTATSQPQAPNRESVGTTKPVGPISPDTSAVGETTTQISNEENVVVDSTKPLMPTSSNTSKAEEIFPTDPIDMSAGPDKSSSKNPEVNSLGGVITTKDPRGSTASLSVSVLLTTLLALFSSYLVWIRN